MKVLVLDVATSSRASLAAVTAICSSRGHDVVVLYDADDGHDGHDAPDASALPPLAGKGAPALVIARDVNGVRRVRAAPFGLAPMLLAVARSGADVATLLEAGADDVLLAGSSDAEVCARLAVLERRSLDDERALSEPLRALPDLIVLVSSSGVFLSVRLGPDYVPRLLDASRVGQTIEQVFAPADAVVLRGALDEVVRTGKPVLFDACYDLRGAQRWFETRMYPGRADDVVVLSRDITERKDVEAKGKQSEARARAVFHSEMFGMLEWSSDGTVIDANDTLLAMIGYTRAELEAGEVSWSKMTPREFWAREERAGAELMTRGVFAPFEKEYIRKDGSRVPILIAGVALDELRSHGLSFVVDMSARKQVEQKLRESNERYALVARATTDAVWDWDIASNAIVWNETFHTLFGYAAEEVDGGYPWWTRSVHPDDRARVERELSEWVAGSASTWLSEYRFLTKDGHYAHIVDRGTMIRDEDGNGVRAIGAMSDVTERTEMQRRLLLADRLASLGTLAAGVAHEINNPLAHVIGNVDVATRHLAALGEHATPALEALADARAGADRVRSIVRDLRTFSRVDEPKKDAVDVRQSLEWATRIAGNAIQIRARLETDYRDVPPIRGDESRLGQVFVNLLVNAAQAIPEGNAAAHRVRVATTLEDGFVVVSVQDSGVGIPPDVRGRIFDPFFTTKDVGVGTGLGLSICHGIVSSLGGTIEVDSAVGEGTTFRVRLPVAEARAPAPKSAPEVSATGRRGRVLIVDDDALTRTLLERTLGLEHEVTSLPAAEPALALLRGGARFDVVFSDLMMPEMTGMDFHAALARVAPDQAERMVFLTAGAVSASAQRFLDDVPNAWLEKPFDLDTLLELTRRRVR